MKDIKDKKVYAFIDANNLNIKTCSVLLKKSAKEKIIFMDNLRKKLEYKAK